ADQPNTEPSNDPNVEKQPRHGRAGRFIQLDTAMKTNLKTIAFAAGAILLGGIVFFAWQTTGVQRGAGDAASQVYVAPGEHDEFYAFMSGGFSGNLTVHGLPSGRLIKTIPVFSQYPENGWGYSEETRAMLETSYGFVPWGDSHHP